MPKNPVPILYVEDDEGLALLLKRRMERQGYTVDTAFTGGEGLEKYAQGQYEAVLLDYRLPDMDALDMLRRMEAEQAHIPILILTALGDERVAVEAMHTGASDYIVKDVNQSYLELLPIVLKSAMIKCELLERTRQQQEALRVNEERFRTIVQQVKDYAIFGMGIDQKPISWNIGVREMLGFEEEEFIGADIIPLIYTPEDIASGFMEREFESAIETGSASRDCWMRRKDGSRFWAAGVTTAFRDSKGEIIGFIKIMRDYSEQRRVEEALSTALEQAQAASIAKTEFLANMSHEIRTPMNAVVGLTDILSHTSPLTERQAQYIETLRLSSQSLLDLINDLLDIAKIENSRVELEKIPFSFADIFTELTGIFGIKAKERGLYLRVEDSPLLNRNFLGDPLRIKQIVTNLISNAIKFTETGGVAVSLSQTRDGELFIAISDTGIGIAEEKREQIFDKFTQADASTSRKYGGTGLGLAISRNLAQVMGGSLEVESVIGQGSTFMLRLPLEPAAAFIPDPENKAIAPDIKEALAAQNKVLLVEDYMANVLVATTLLEDLGYQCDVANDGHEALAILHERRGRYCAVLMDVQMPGMDGFQVTRQLREEEKNAGLEPLKIIAMTAHALTGDRERCLAAGMDDYISKPFNPMDLKRVLTKFCQSAAA